MFRIVHLNEIKYLHFKYSKSRSPLYHQPWDCPRFHKHDIGAVTIIDTGVTISTPTPDSAGLDMFLITINLVKLYVY